MAKKRTFAEMLAAQKKANQKTYSPIETSGDYATNIAVQEDTPTPSPTQPLVPPAPASSTAVAPSSTDINLDAPAAPPEGETNVDDEDEETVITKYMKQLGDKLREAAPHIDYASEYSKLLEENQRPERRGISPFKAFALSLGGGPQAAQKLHERAEDENDEEDSRWKEVMNFKEQALKGDIQQKLEEGKFKQALAQSEELAKMQAALSRITEKRKFKQEIDKIKEQNKGKTDVANIRADVARQNFQTKLDSLAENYKLAGDIKKEFFKQAFITFRQRLVAQDITGEHVISADDFARALEDAVDWAEEHSGEDLTKPPARIGSTPPASTPAANLSPEDKAKQKLAEIRARSKKE